MNKQNKWMEIACVNFNWWEVIDTQFVHHHWVDSVNLLAFFVLMIMASFHIIENDSFHMSKNDSQIMSQKLNWLNLSFPVFSHNDWLWEHVSFSNVVNKDFIGEFFEQNSCKVKILSIIGHESGCCKIINFVVDMRLMWVLSAVNIFAESCRSAFRNVSGVGWILSVNKEEFIAHPFELLFSEESVLEQWWFLIPVNESVILL